ncbi:MULTISPECIES: hypothetical protein [Pseudonocardia]|uniref:ARB-07466-like C-terminal domain-containing protein n=2 Tax=Pseudonocardia TaxID=1847 RepID=A0A1Y2MZJ5_PSEAH|nr:MULTISPECIES: hypothetical protein [Pseudonocardia]OSY40592.1 hypothetical protein BG845_02668 [Pseudonocardia autotrophica]TDN73611.1 hypothetical protein C8E95_2715 [Pseudonocardia autotrophica]BBG04355.1 hypothetical protein Pdca_55640 [Pseudonocardia autotrophica]GEC25221.1 hypothetical protein PSA01_22500 [Pseudonocardia saturnea]
MPRHRHRRADETRSGIRHVATAAAVASGALAVVTPVAGLEFGPVQADLRLASETTDSADGADELDLDTAFADAAAAAEAPRTEPVLGADLVRSAGLLDATADAGRAAGEEAERVARDAAAQARSSAGRDRPQPGEGAGRGGPSSASCDVDTSGLGPVKSWVADAAEFLSCAYGQPDLIGVAQRSSASDHPTGHALDLMVRGETGDRIAECALANSDELGVKYVIWEQQMNHGSGWTEMSDRGGDTANHVDHVHISFEKSPGSGDPDLGKCA